MRTTYPRINVTLTFLVQSQLSHVMYDNKLRVPVVLDGVELDVTNISEVAKLDDFTSLSFLIEVYWLVRYNGSSHKKRLKIM